MKTRKERKKIIKKDICEKKYNFLHKKKSLQMPDLLIFKWFGRNVETVLVCI